MPRLLILILLVIKQICVFSQSRPECRDYIVIHRDTIPCNKIVGFSSDTSMNILRDVNGKSRHVIKIVDTYSYYKDSKMRTGAGSKTIQMQDPGFKEDSIIYRKVCDDIDYIRMRLKRANSSLN